MKHSPTISILLKTDADDLSVGALEELHLLISICADVLHLVPKSELVCHAHSWLMSRPNLFLCEGLR